jgi:hypothetical protein
MSCHSRYSWIWLFFLPWAGSLIGILIRWFPLAITLLISAEYSVEMSASSKCLNILKPSTSSYHFTQWFIFPSSTFPTRWSTYIRPHGFCLLYSFTGESIFLKTGMNSAPPRFTFSSE